MRARHPAARLRTVGYIPGLRRPTSALTQAGPVWLALAGFAIWFATTAILIRSGPQCQPHVIDEPRWTGFIEGRPMNTPTITNGDRSNRLLVFARCHDAQLFAIKTALTSAETALLQIALDQLIEIGMLALYRFDTPVLGAENWQGLVAHLRREVGALGVEAALTAAAYPATATPMPQTLVPVWPFERLNGQIDVLTACGLFMGASITFEALPVLDADLTEPIPSVSARFARWRAATGRNVMLGTVAIPGGDTAHAVFASVRAG